MTISYTTYDVRIWWEKVYFGLMYEIKENVLPDVSDRHKVYGLGQTLLAGFTGGVIATLFNAPFDVVKSRFQQQSMEQRYKYTLSTLWMIYKSSGIRGCYRGLEAKIIRMGIGGAVCMTTFESLCMGYHHWIEQDRGQMEAGEDTQMMV